MDEQVLRPQQNDLLRQARKEKFLTQRQLAEILNVSGDAVRSWEHGRRFPSADLMKKLSDFFQKTSSELGFEEVVKNDKTVESDTASINEEKVLNDKLMIRETLRSRHVNVNRRRMIRRVRSIWIDGVLKESLHQAALIALGLQEQPDALENPWYLAVQETDLPPKPLPPGTSIVEVYDAADGDLLILGEPGAGKTTLLLELAQVLLNRADQEETDVIAVIFNLSSWATKQLSLTEWLIEELVMKYHVPRKVAQFWIQDDQLIVLLDGLDEVASSMRSACVNAINHYKSLHDVVPVVVCCRTTEYFQIETRVLLQQAVLVRPLTVDQIHSYLSKAGGQLEGIQRALEEDIDLQEMAKTPLMLSILTLVYAGKDENIVLVGSPETRRRQVLQQYAQRMLTRRAKASYTESQTNHWLSWLARQMQQRSLTEFSVERMQPDWLDGHPRSRFDSLVIRFIYSIEVIVLAALFAWIRGGKIGNTFGVGAGLFGELGGGKGNAIFAWMSPGVGGGVEAGGSLGIIFALIFSLQLLLISTITSSTISWKSVWHGLKYGIKNGLITLGTISIFTIPIFSVLGGIWHGLTYGFGMGLFSGLLVGLLTGLIMGLRYNVVGRQVGQDQDRLFRTRLIDGLVIGLWAGLSFALVDFALGIVIKSVIVYGLIAGFFFFIAFGFAGGTSLIAGLGTIKPAESVSWSWSSIQATLLETLRKGVVIAGLITLCVGVVIAIASSVFYGFGYGARYGLIYGLIIGIVAGLTGVLASLLNNGWSSTLLNANQLFLPNEGIRRSLTNALLAGILFVPIGGLLSGVVCGIAFGFIGELAGWLILGIGFTLVFGLLIGFQFAMINGGSAYIEHYLLRWQLWQIGVLPMHYVAFLDYAASRILLRKVGGSYMFVHRILLDYFASLPSEDA